MRLTLTNRELASEVGAVLRDYLWWIAEDGYVSDQEIRHMQGWLTEAEGVGHIAAFHYLKELVDAVLADGVIEESERAEIHRSILRVLPKDYRALATERKDDVERTEKLNQAAEFGQLAAEKARKREKATDRQISYLQDLGGIVTAGMTKTQASIQISELTTRRATVRQQMVLKFWNRSDLASRGVDEVSEWMDAWYDEDPRRLIAWELWKEEVGDYGVRDPKFIKRVPEGGGKRYLKKVGKISRSSAQRRLNGDSSNGTGCFRFSTIFVLLVFLVLAVRGCVG